MSRKDRYIELLEDIQETLTHGIVGHLNERFEAGEMGAIKKHRLLVIALERAQKMRDEFLKREGAWREGSDQSGR